MIKTKADQCPCCFAFINSATGVEKEDVPSPGDVSVCFKCGAYLMFDLDLKLAPLSNDEFEKLHPDTKKILFRISEAIRHFKDAS